MDTAANQLRTNDDLPADPVTAEDGGNLATSYTPPAPQPTVQADDQEKNSETVHWKDDRRSEIFSRAREKRAEDLEPYSGDPNDVRTLYGTNADPGDLGDLEQEALRRQQQHRQDQISQIAGQQPQPQTPQRKPLNGLDPQFLSTPVPVIVDGEQREVTVEEALREYQINRAADKRLEQAKALIRQTQEFQRQQQPQPGFDAAEYDEQSGQDDLISSQETDSGNNNRRPVNADELIDKIQIGSKEEAWQALDDFVSEAVNRRMPADESTRVLSAIEDHNAKQAVISFAEKNPQIATNPVVQAVATRQIHEHMREDLLRAGYTEAQLQQHAPTQAHLIALHKQARIQGVRGVRQVSDLIAAGYQGAIQNLRSIVDQIAPSSAPNQAQNMQQRQQRKESLQPQPVARRLSTGITSPSQNRTQEQSRSQAVQQMRKARGQPT